MTRQRNSGDVWLFRLTGEKTPTHLQFLTTFWPQKEMYMEIVIETHKHFQTIQIQNNVFLSTTSCVFNTYK